MIFGLALLPVIAATAVMTALTVVWYAPQVFGEVWMRDTKLTKNPMDLDSEDAPKIFAFVLLANLIAVLFLSKLAAIAQGAEMAPLKLGLGLFLFIFLAYGMQTLFERRGFIGFCVSVSYMGLMIITGLSIVTYWPW